MYRLGQPWLPVVLGSAVAMFGLLVLAGAWIDPDALAQLLPVARQIGLRTAVGFIVAGVAVSVVGNDKAARPVGLAAALVLFLLAGIGLLMLLAGAPEAGYGRSLLEYLPAGAQLAAWPGRMSLPTAIAFGLCGLALVQRPGAGAVAAQVVIGAIILLGAGGMLMQASGLASLYQLVPNMAVMSWPTGAGFILLGLGLLIHGVNAPWFRTYYAGREDRRVFAAGIAILLALVLIGWSVGVGQFARQSVAAAQRTLQESLRINAVLADDALEAAAANAGQVLALSRLEELLAAGGGTRPAVQAELERIMRSARATGVRSIHVLAPDGNIVAQSGLAALPVLLEAPLGMAGEHRLRWSNDWRFAARIGLARDGRPLGSAVVELRLPALEKLFATVRHASASREFLLCAQASGEPQCFPSHIQPGITKLPPRPDGRPWPAALALRGKQGMTVLSDPLGFDVMAAYAPVAKTGLGAVEKVRIDELFGPLRRELLYAFMLLMALCIGGSFVLYWQVTPVMRRIVRLQADMGAVLANVPTGIVWIDQQRRILGANLAVERLFGYTHDELAGRDLAELVPALTPALTPAVADEMTAGGQPPRVSHGQRRDGGALRIEFALTDYAIEGEKRFACMVQDVGEREQAIEKLRYWGLIFERARWGVVIGGANAKVIDTMNPEFARMHGYTVEELTGRPIVDVFAPEVRAEVPEFLRRVHELGHYQYESLHVRKDGTVFPVFIDATAVRDEHGQVQFRVVNVQDITQRKQVEEELLRSREQLRELAAYSDNVREIERKRIAREVHDELGQLLTALRMRLSLLLQQHDEDPEMTGQMTEMRLLVDRMVGVVRHVVSNLRPAPLNLGIVPALEWLAEDFEQHSGIHCNLHVPDLAGGAGDTLTLDDTRATAVFRIVQESLTNVVRHSGANKVTISLMVAQNYIALQVKDNGKGFDPVIAGASRSFGLLGMRERALLLHGELQINSAPGRGTTLSLKLPLERRARARAGARAHDTNRNGIQGS